MKLKLMKYSVIVFVSTVFFSLRSNAQGEHFIYIQADGSQNFNASFNGKSYVSSTTGYLIIPQIKDSIYDLSIDLKGANAAKLDFSVTVKQKDAGYQLKNFGSKGWGLFNLQTMGVIMPSSGSQKNTDSTNAFGSMLGDVVNDSTLGKPIAAATVSASEPPPSISGQPSTNIIATASEIPSPDSVVADGPKGIIKALQESADTGTKVMFIEFHGLQNDTVNIFIPAFTEASVANNNSAPTNLPTNTTAATASPVKENAAIETNAGPVNNSAPAVQDKGISNPFYASKDSSANLASANNLNSETPSTLQPSAKTNCSNTANDADMIKLRKKMLTKTDVTDMIVIAKKQLQGKCVSTDQVKNIGVLFDSDEGRYDFYEAMYKFTYDYDNYASLQNQLIDSYYKKRFLALLR